MVVKSIRRLSKIDKYSKVIDCNAFNYTRKSFKIIEESGGTEYMRIVKCMFFIIITDC